MAQIHGSFDWNVDREEAKYLLPLFGVLLTFKERRFVTSFFGLEGQVALSRSDMSKQFGVSPSAAAGRVKAAAEENARSEEGPAMTTPLITAAALLGALLVLCVHLWLRHRREDAEMAMSWTEWERPHVFEIDVDVRPLVEKES